MWTLDYIGLYAQYAAVGLVYGSTGISYNFCVYYYEGATNLCANANNIILLAWSFKIVVAIFTDSYRPFGLRRRPYMLAGWSLVFLILLILACVADTLSANTWLAYLVVSQVFLMIADVPADGYCVELGKMEPPETRGQILATGQRIRFTFSIFAGFLQTFLVNGPSTNKEDCEISWSECWSWGLSVGGYYGLLSAFVFILTVPMYFLKEPDASKIPKHTVKEFIAKLWDTLQNLTTFYVLIYIIGIHAFANFTSNAALLLQYYVIGLTNFQSGIDTMTSYVAIVAGVVTFQKFLINKNWRFTSYLSTIVTSLLSLLWLLAFHDIAGLRNGWYTIFVDMDQSFTQGLSQVLYSMAVIELAHTGLEATTYELMVSVGNASLTVAGILGTQLLWPVNANGCEEDDCPSNSVDVTSEEAFEASDGPARFTHYQVLLMGISIVANIIFTQFLPTQKDQCEEWKKKGEEMGQSTLRGYVTLTMCVVVVSYGILASVLLLDTDTSCLKVFGGAGCD
ncbi:unnamed protein product [Ectocarpus fasciculatus]